ncbi:MAG: hypothetical protein ACTSSQ_00790 [Alphaproteobacteria bacterium]
MAPATRQAAGRALPFRLWHPQTWAGLWTRRWKLNRAALLGHARIFAHPAYARLVTTEPVVRFLIPVLIVLFVLALGYTRTVALIDQRAGIETDVRGNIALIAKAVVTDLQDMDIAMPATGASAAVHGILANALPSGALNAGRRLVLTSTPAAGWC